MSSNYHINKFDISNSATLEICHGDYETHYDASISICDGADLLNLKINKPGNTVTIESNINCLNDLIVKSGATLSVEAVNTISVNNN